MIKSGFVSAFGPNLLCEKELYCVVVMNQEKYFYSTNLKVLKKVSMLFGKDLIMEWRIKKREWVKINV